VYSGQLGAKEAVFSQMGSVSFEFIAQEGHMPSSFPAAACSCHPPYPSIFGFTVVGLLLLFNYRLVPILVPPVPLHLGIADFSNRGCGADY